MFECKRVGVEEGNKKGPQTIEKAKQGAYVARTVSSLQKIRIHSGEMHGVIPKKDGTLYSKPYVQLIDEVVHSQDPELLRHFILTVGVVSNHGNWFTSDNPNKELRVLAQSYDWLLFLTDDGLAEFIADILQSEARCSRPGQSGLPGELLREEEKEPLHQSPDGAGGGQGSSGLLQRRISAESRSGLMLFRRAGGPSSG